MNEQFCSYEIALKLKELGFNEECFGIYGSCDEEFVIVRNANKLVAISPDDTLAPLWQQVIDWFREKHRLAINNPNQKEVKIFCVISEDNSIVKVITDTDFYKARKQAILKAIELCKKN